MHGLVRAGRDSDDDLIMLFGILSKFVTDTRRQVREMVVLLSGPGTMRIGKIYLVFLKDVFEQKKGVFNTLELFKILGYIKINQITSSSSHEGTPEYMMMQHYIKDFSHLPFKPRPATAEEVYIRTELIVSSQHCLSVVNLR